jgi:hypothetical protein
MHEVTFDIVEYSPAAHSVHELAPVPVPLSVIEPAAQSLQYPWPSLDWYLPAGHSTQAAPLVPD